VRTGDAAASKVGAALSFTLSQGLHHHPTLLSLPSGGPRSGATRGRRRASTRPAY